MVFFLYQLLHCFNQHAFHRHVRVSKLFVLHPFDEWPVSVTANICSRQLVQKQRYVSWEMRAYKFETPISQTRKFWEYV